MAGVGPLNLGCLRMWRILAESLSTTVDAHVRTHRQSRENAAISPPLNDTANNKHVNHQTASQRDMIEVSHSQPNVSSC